MNMEAVDETEGLIRIRRRARPRAGRSGRAPMLGRGFLRAEKSERAQEFIIFAYFCRPVPTPMRRVRVYVRACVRVCTSLARIKGGVGGG